MEEVFVALAHWKELGRRQFERSLGFLELRKI